MIHWDLVRGIIYTVSRINEPYIPEKKEYKIKGTGIAAYTDENKGRCPKSATIPGFVCHHLPPQTCFHVTESIPMGKCESCAFCVSPIRSGFELIFTNDAERSLFSLRLLSRFLRRELCRCNRCALHHGNVSNTREIVDGCSFKFSERDKTVFQHSI